MDLAVATTTYSDPVLSALIQAVQVEVPGLSPAAALRNLLGHSIEARRRLRVVNRERARQGDWGHLSNGARQRLAIIADAMEQARAGRTEVGRQVAWRLLKNRKRAEAAAIGNRERAAAKRAKKLAALEAATKPKRPRVRIRIGDETNP